MQKEETQISKKLCFIGNKPAVVVYMETAGHTYLLFKESSVNPQSDRT